MNARAGALADDKVNAKIFHGGIEDFLYGGLQAMDFVKEENFLFFEGGEDGGEVAFAIEQRASAGLDGNIEFVGDDLGERGFAEARRTIEKNMIEGFAAGARGFDGDGDVFLDAFLADVFVEALGADAGVEAGIIVNDGAGDDARGARGTVGGQGREISWVRSRAWSRRYQISAIRDQEAAISNRRSAIRNQESVCRGWFLISDN